MSQVTCILNAIGQGDRAAAEELLPLIYDELRKLAAAKMAHEKPGQTLQPTALVHEAYIRLVDGDAARQWDGRGHFFAAAAEAMRRILVDSARRKQSEKRGGGGLRFELCEGDLVTGPPDLELLDLDEALRRLEQTDHQLAELVKLRTFGGMTFEEVAACLGISIRTAKRNWAYARAWLGREMRTSQRSTS